jgi:NAD+ kinase
MSARKSLAPSSDGTPRVLVVYKKSAWQTHVKERKNARYIALLKQGNVVTQRLEEAHRQHQATLEETKLALDALGVRSVFRFRGDEGLVEGFDLVVTVGGDGTLLWAARWVGVDLPMVAINSAPGDSVGHFCAGKKGAVLATLELALAGKLHRSSLTRMEVKLAGEVVTRRVLNDILFSHASPAGTTRCVLRLDKGDGKVIEEEQKSSGIWVGPPAGSTAAQRSAGGKVLPAESTKLQYVVREPYIPDDGSGKRLPMGGEALEGPRRGAQTLLHLRSPRLRLGTISPQGALTIVSKVRDGRIFIDGPHRVRDVEMGEEIVLRASDEPLTLLGYPRAKKTR